MKRAWNKWKEIAEKIGNFQANLIFSILYFVLVVPFGVVSNLLGDFLKVRQKPRWEKYEIDVSSLEKLKEQS